MVYGLYLSADGLTTQQYRQSVIANNLANVNTAGFKPDRVAFAERLNESALRGTAATRNPVLDGATGGLTGLPVYTDFSEGSIIPSGNPLDVAILKDGFLTIQTPEGTRYTRDGRLAMDPDGTLRHGASGGLVVDPQGKPIVLNPNARGEVKIDERGRIRQDESVAGQLSLVDFEDRQQLLKTGENLFNGEGARRVKIEGSVQQKAYEASGIAPTRELVNMIAATRAYQANATLITMQDESLGRVVNDVGRIG